MTTSPDTLERIVAELRELSRYERPPITGYDVSKLADRLEKLSAASVQVTDGLVLVPRAPTQDMLDSASAAMDRGDWIGQSYWEKGWKAMIEATLRLSPQGEDHEN